MHLRARSREAAHILLLLLLVGGCMTERLPLPAEHPGVPQQSHFLVQRIGHDEHGRPVFTGPLSSRPSAVGETFTVVQTINGLPSRSYDIAIVKQPKTGPGPLAVIYEWTGRGFEAGVEFTGLLLQSGVSISSDEEAAVYLAMVVSPIVITTATGFMVGTIASIPETAKELRRVIVSAGETVTGYRDYTYDDRRRIRFMKLYPPEERGAPLVRTEFFYEGTGMVPVRAEVSSMAEQKVRQVP